MGSDDYNESKRMNYLQVPAGDDFGIPGVMLNPENDQAVDCSSFTEITFIVWDNRGKIILRKTLTGNGIIWDTDYAGDGTDGRYKIVLYGRDTINLEGIYHYVLKFDDATPNKTTPVDSFIEIKENKK